MFTSKFLHWSLLLSLFLIPNIGWAEFDYESEPVANERRESLKGTWIGLGPASLGNLNVTGVAYSFTAGYAYSLDQTVLQIGARATFGGGALFSSAHLGGHYYFLDSATSPFVGATLGLGLVRTAASTGKEASFHTGFVLTPKLGMQFLRDADVQLEVALYGSFLFKSTSEGYPNSLGLNVSIYF